MKTIYRILLASTALLAVSQFASAQEDWSIDGQIKDPKDHVSTLTWPKDTGVQLPAGTDFGYSKNISSPQKDGTYWIKLESFATGSATMIEASVPADIVLVLDVSSSMFADRGSAKNYYLDIEYVNNNIRSGDGGPLPFTYKNLNGLDGQFFYMIDGQNRPESRREVHAETTGSGNNKRYFLYYQDTDGKHYFNVDGSVVSPVNNKPTGVTRETDVLFHGTLVHYRVKQRIDALREAVKAFIGVIDHNDLYEDETFDHPRGGSVSDANRLGNRISIITFASADHVDVQNSLGEGSLSGGKAAQLIADVDSYRLYSGTRQDEGLKKAYQQFVNYVDATRMEAATRTVVLFTDGDPYASGITTATLYDNGISEAQKLKKKDNSATQDTIEGYGATVFSVGLFSNKPATNGNVWKFMNYMSSNAPNASNMSTPGTEWDSTKGFYKDASDESVDLSSVFTEIAHQSGGSTAKLNASSANVDVVSNSFILPPGTDTENIESVVKVFVAKLEKIENGNYKFYKEYLAGHAPDDYTYRELDADGAPFGSPKKVDAGISVSLNGTREIKVKGFDYRSCFCGTVIGEDNSVTYQGYKLIIMIPIKMNPEAVGGPNVETNGAGSGIFIKDGDATAFVPYKSPTVSLPVNIHITKTGLEGGESAKFKIERAILPEGENVNVASLTDWTYVTTVFVTKRKGSTTDPIVKIKGLPANIEVTEGTGDSATTTEKNVVYRITEEKWSWSYTAKTAPKYTATMNITNPFTFDNEKKENIDVLIKHAESKATNSFKPKADGSTVGDVKYDDSKTNTRP